MRGRSGSTGALHARSSMSLANVAYNASLGWADPTLRTLEAQMAVPMFNEHPIELGLKGREAEVVARFDRGGRRSRPVSRRVSRRRDSGDARQHRQGDRRVRAHARVGRLAARSVSLSRRQERDVGRRAARHEGVLLAASAVWGVPWVVQPVWAGGFRGRAEAWRDARSSCFTTRGSTTSTDAARIRRSTAGSSTSPGAQTDMGRFRAPTLRNIAVTAPYMHDGSVADARRRGDPLCDRRQARAPFGATACAGSGCRPARRPMWWRSSKA